MSQLLYRQSTIRESEFDPEKIVHLFHADDLVDNYCVKIWKVTTRAHGPWCYSDFVVAKNEEEALERLADIVSDRIDEGRPAQDHPWFGHAKLDADYRKELEAEFPDTVTYLGNYSDAYQLDDVHISLYSDNGLPQAS